MEGPGGHAGGRRPHAPLSRALARSASAVELMLVGLFRVLQALVWSFFICC